MSKSSKKQADPPLSLYKSRRRSNIRIRKEKNLKKNLNILMNWISIRIEKIQISTIHPHDRRLTIVINYFTWQHQNIWPNHEVYCRSDCLLIEESNHMITNFMQRSLTRLLLSLYSHSKPRSILKKTYCTFFRISKSIIDLSK